MMALKDTIKRMHNMLTMLTYDLKKAETGNKAASQRVRTGSIQLSKLAKIYRKESVAQEKGIKKVRTQGKRTVRAKTIAKKGVSKKKTKKNSSSKSKTSLSA